MKRLGVFVSILMLTLGLFGGFSGPEHAHATVNQSDADAVTQHIRDVLSKIPNINPTSSIPSDLLGMVKSSANTALHNAMSLPDEEGLYFTGLDLEIATIDIYLQKLADQEALTTGPVGQVVGQVVPGRENKLQVINAYRTELDLLKRQDTITNKLSSGQITQAEADTQNAAALQNADKYRSSTQKQITDSSNECSFGLVGEMHLSACISEGFTWFVKTILLNLATYLFSLAANMLNLAVQIGIFDFAKWASNSLYPLWIIVRQIISLIIVFVGLYLGFLYILGNNTTFGRFLPWVVAFGLFVNFSYPLSRTAIDISNIVSLNLYTNSVGGDVFLPDTSTVKDRKTPGTIMLGKLGIQNLVNNTLKIPDAETSNNSLNTPYGAVVAVAVVGYAAYIFFVATFIMVIRTLTLIFITVLSPLLLVDAVLPILGNKAKELRGLFLNQLIVGPVFMLMLALTFKFLDIFSLSTGIIGTGGGDTLATTGASGATNTDSVKTIFSLLMMLGMLHITLKVTRSFSGEVGKLGSEMLGTVGGFGLGVASGGAGFLARKGIGGLALKAKESGWVQKNQHTALGRMAHGFSNSLANSTFDLRNSSVVAGGVKKLGMGISSGMGMGTGPKVGFEAAADERAKKIAERSQKIKVKHSSDVYETDANGNKVLKHRAGTVDEAATRAARERFNNVRGGAIFQSKEEKEKIDELLKNNKDAVDRKILSDYKEFDDTPEGMRKKRLFFESQSPEIRTKLKKYDDDQLAEKTKRELKEQEDKAYRNDTLQTQKDLVQAQKDLASALKNNQQTSSNTGAQPGNNQTQGQGTTSASGNTGSANADTGTPQDQSGDKSSASTKSENMYETSANEPFNVETMSVREQAEARRKAAQSKAVAVARRQLGQNDSPTAVVDQPSPEESRPNNLNTPQNPTPRTEMAVNSSA